MEMGDLSVGGLNYLGIRKLTLKKDCSVVINVENLSVKSSNSVYIKESLMERCLIM